MCPSQHKRNRQARSRRIRRFVTPANPRASQLQTSYVVPTGIPTWRDVRFPQRQPFGNLHRANAPLAARPLSVAADQALEPHRARLPSAAFSVFVNGRQCSSGCIGMTIAIGAPNPASFGTSGHLSGVVDLRLQWKTSWLHTPDDCLLRYCEITYSQDHVHPKRSAPSS